MYLSRTIDIKKLIWLLNLIVIGYSLNAQTGWSINVADYEYSGDVTGIVTVNGVEVSDGAVGAFVGDECRGFTDSSLYFSPTGKRVFQFLVYSNVTSGEYLSFRYYNPSDGEIYVVEDSLEFVSNMIIGNANEPYLFNVNINAAPEIASAIGNQSVNERFGSLGFNLDTVFTDADGDKLTYTAVSGDEDVCTVSISESMLSITEQAPGNTTILVEATDGIDAVSFSFNITIIDINFAPLLDKPFPDSEMVENIDSLVFRFNDFFSDPDNEPLVYSIDIEDETVLSYVMNDSEVKFTPLAVGQSEVSITATDAEGLFVSDMLILEVVKENLLLLKLKNSRKIKNRDTISVCNRAGSVTLNVLTVNDWDFVSPNNLWTLLTLENDSTMTVSFSENLSGEDRMAKVKVTDSQGHEIEFFVLQTENCETSTNEYKNASALNVYPNPTNDAIIVKLEGSGKLRRIELFSLDGRLIHQENYPNTNDAPLTIDMLPYKEGFYFLHVIDGEVRHTRKILKN